MNLTAAQRHYLFRGHIVVPLVINVVVNALAGRIAFRHMHTIPIRGIQDSVVADLIGTSFFLTLITGLIASPLVRRDVRLRHVEPFRMRAFIARWIPANVLLRSILAAILLTALLAGPVFAGCLLLPQTGISRLSYIAIKCGFAAVLGMLVTPMFALAAMSDDPKEQRV
jgi:hypothetical protein